MKVIRSGEVRPTAELCWPRCSFVLVSTLPAPSGSRRQLLDSSGHLIGLTHSSTRSQPFHALAPRWPMRLVLCVAGVKQTECWTERFLLQAKQDRMQIVKGFIFFKPQTLPKKTKDLSVAVVFFQLSLMCAQFFFFSRTLAVSSVSDFLLLLLWA